MYQYPETPFVPFLRPKRISHLPSICREEVPKGWVAYRHPEGGLYFVHGDSVSASGRYRIALLSYLKFHSIENVYRSEHMRWRPPQRYRVLQNLFVQGAES